MFISKGQTFLINMKTVNMMDHVVVIVLLVTRLKGSNKGPFLKNFLMRP